jgi:hypothetical protein
VESGKISYAGVGAAVAGVIGIVGVYSAWWETPTATYNGTADISGTLAFVMGLAVFAFGGAYVLIADPQIRRAMGALATLCAVVLGLSCIWGISRADNVAPGATTSSGLFVSGLGAVLGIAAGFLVMRDNMQRDAEVASGGTPAPASDMPPETSTDEAGA